MEYIKRSLEAVDCFYIPISLKHRNKRKFKSSIGGLVSIVIVLCLAFVLINMLINILMKRDSQLTSTLVKHDSPPIFSINQNFTEYDGSSEGETYFLFGLAFSDKESKKFLSLEQVRGDFFIEVEFFSKTSGVASRFLSDLVKCSDYTPTPPIRIDQANYESYYCIKEKQFQLGGREDDADYRSVNIFVRDCNNKENYYIRQCFSAQANRQHNPYKYDISIIYSDSQINNEIHGNQVPINIFYQSQLYSINEWLIDELEYYVSYNLIQTFEGIFLGFVSPYNFRILGMGKVLRFPMSKKDYFFKVSLRSHSHSFLITRTYESIIYFIALMGGLVKAFIMIGGLIVIPINWRLLMVDLINRVFNVIDPKKEQLLESEAHLDLSKLSKGMDKSPLEVGISVQYYKYERNRGLKYTIKQAIQETSFACTDKEQYILGEGFRKFDERLEAKELFKFANEVNILKNCLFDSNRFLLDYYVSKLIHKDNINSKNGELPSQKADAFNEALRKNNQLIEGLRGLKNKPLLDQGYDLNLIRQLNISKDLLRRYFINHKAILVEEWKKDELEHLRCHD